MSSVTITAVTYSCNSLLTQASSVVSDYGTPAAHALKANNVNPSVGFLHSASDSGTWQCGVYNLAHYYAG